MDQRKIVYQETAIVAIGEVVLSAIMVGVFALFGYFKMNVLWGALLGCCVMIVNHFFLAVTACLAADRAEQGEVQQGQKMMQTSSTVRLVFIGAVLVAGIKLGANILSLLLPILFARPVLILSEFFRKKVDQ